MSSGVEWSKESRVEWRVRMGFIVLIKPLTLLCFGFGLGCTICIYRELTVHKIKYNLAMSPGFQLVFRSVDVCPEEGDFFQLSVSEEGALVRPTESG